ncbi:MAG: polysaccharide biosynthesis tyrosine autokinase [Nitrosomonas sp.]|nr:polysaccharide biosynthesis tyrosine autokinase [Nitrosomonas sp.]
MLSNPGFVLKQDAASSTESAPGRSAQIGQILLNMEKITLDDVDKILQLQQQEGILFGAAARQLGLVTDRDIQQALASQSNHSSLSPEQVNDMPDLIVVHQPFIDQVEFMRAVRSQLIMRWFSTGQKSIAVIEINPTGGASLLVANLAVLFSQLGKRTLLIDADLRNPRQHEIFNLQDMPGFSDALAGRKALSEVISKKESITDLAILSAGEPPSNPSELLSRAMFADKGESLHDQYDVVLYDAPAFMTSSDALLVTARAGGVLLAVRKNHTRFTDIQAIKSQLSSHGTPIIGTVLIDL